MAQDRNEILDETQGQQPEQSTANESGIQEDIFTEIFGGPAVEEFVATDTSQQQPDNQEVAPSDSVPVNEDPRSDDSQFQYWQSQADKRQAEVDLLKEQVAQLSEQKIQPEAQVQKETEVSKPVKPRKPAGFSHSEALDDPESDSAKYLSQKDQYVDDLADYMEHTENQRQQSAVMQEKERQVALRNQQVMSDLQTRHSYSAAEAADFIEVMNDPSSMSLDNLVQLHKIRRGARTQAGVSQAQVQRQAQVQQKVAEMDNRQKNLTVPQPLGVQSGASVQSSTKVEDQMMDSMIQNHKKRNPFG
tara:strand:+ start:920 stop:1828 length:909 start_codon:yes stop_codon:yes gene_type:complete